MHQASLVSSMSIISTRLSQTLWPAQMTPVIVSSSRAPNDNPRIQNIRHGKFQKHVVQRKAKPKMRYFVHSTTCSYNPDINQFYKNTPPSLDFTNVILAYNTINNILMHRQNTFRKISSIPSKKVHNQALHTSSEIIFTLERHYVQMNTVTRGISYSP